jgi:hypothetical protein
MRALEIAVRSAWSARALTGFASLALGLSGGRPAAAQERVESPGESAAAPAGEGAAESPASSFRASAFVDPLGFALFGPRLGLEAGAGHFSGALAVRWFNAGLLAHSLFLQQGDAFTFSYGAGARARYYFVPGLEGAHLGIAAEYLSSSVDNHDSLIATHSSYLVPYAEAGYRWAFGHLYADIAGGAGYALRLSSSASNLPGGDPARTLSVTDESSIYATASLELGFSF